MSGIPERTNCPECGREIALQSGEFGSVLRYHKDDESGSVCRGSGEHVDEDAIKRKEEAMRDTLARDHVRRVILSQIVDVKVVEEAVNQFQGRPRAAAEDELRIILNLVQNVR